MHVCNEYVSIFQLIHATVEYFNASSIHADMSIIQSMIGAVVYKLYSNQSHPPLLRPLRSRWGRESASV